MAQNGTKSTHFIYNFIHTYTALYYTLIHIFFIQIYTNLGLNSYPLLFHHTQGYYRQKVKINKFYFKLFYAQKIIVYYI